MSFNRGPQCCRSSKDRDGTVVPCETGKHSVIKGVHVRPFFVSSYYSHSSHCRYNEAIATIRRVPALEHNFQLVITRVYEDGDQELLEDEDESAYLLVHMSSNATHL